jgi:two-component system chemotaxis response regulator CheB
MRKIRVLVVDDSMVFRELLARNLDSDPEITVVATAKDAYEARDMLISHKVDVMTLDLEMPRMGGLEFIRKLMPQYPVPIVVVSSLSDKVFDALKAGAVDFVAKPAVRDRERLEYFVRTELASKVKIAAVAKLGAAKKTEKTRIEKRLPVGHKDMVVAIGASTGGTEAILQVVQEFGTDIPGVVIVQHMPAGFTEMYAQRLDRQCRMEVKEAKSGDEVRTGRILLAPGGESHMELVRVNGSYQVVLKRAPKVNGHCPSVDVLFHSVAKVAGANALGIILTGMGADGAKGLLAMRHAGAVTIGQDESTCVVYGMPKVAYELGAVTYQEKLKDIAKRTYTVINKK